MVYPWYGVIPSELLNGGFIAFPFFTSPMQGLICLAIGSAVTGIVLALIKKKVTDEDEKQEVELGKELSDEDLWQHWNWNHVKKKAGTQLCCLI